MLAAKMVDRMIKNSSKSGGRYVSVHLRFEEVLFFLSLQYSGEIIVIIAFCYLLQFILTTTTFDLAMKDMVAFSCCIYDGGEEEKHDMDIVRERSWRGKFRRRGRVIRPRANRVDGKCPLTPLEVSERVFYFLPRVVWDLSTHYSCDTWRSFLNKFHFLFLFHSIFSGKKVHFVKC